MSKTPLYIAVICNAISICAMYAHRDAPDLLSVVLNLALAGWSILAFLADKTNDNA